jgi:hypothetical protein
MHIAILFRKVDENLDLSCYTIYHLAELWRKCGFNVVYVYGVDKHVPADLIIVHIDFSIVPKEYLDYAANYPIALNGQLGNICKSGFSKGLLKSDSDWGGEVIVKSNFNYGGIQEQIYSNILRKPHVDLYWRVISKVKRIMGREPLFSDACDYKIFDKINLVPKHWFHSSKAIVEKFVPEMEDNLYHIRMFQVLGDRWTCERLASPDPIVKDANCVKVEVVEPEAEVFEWCRELKLDYGKLDYVMRDGKPILLDVNKTIGAAGFTSKNENDKRRKYLDKKRKHLSEGIFSYFEN